MKINQGPKSTAQIVALDRAGFRLTEEEQVQLDDYRKKKGRGKESLALHSAAWARAKQNKDKKPKNDKKSKADKYWGPSEPDNVS